MFLLLAAGVASPAPPPSSPSQSTKDQAQAQAAIGHNDLHLQRLSEAQAHCDAALKLDPSNEAAKECLDLAAGMLVDQDLNSADAKLLSGDKRDAIALASKWAHAAALPRQQERSWKILNKARSTSLHDAFLTFTPAWLRQALVTIAILVLLALPVLAARKLRREWQGGHSRGGRGKTKWNMRPLKELPGLAELQTGVPTGAVLDAFARLGDELERPLWRPQLLLLRPTPPANYEPAVISAFLPQDLTYLELAPGVDNLRLEWELHEVQLDEAVQSLQLKTAAGIDIGSVARFLRSIVEWFNSGAPTISGVAQTYADKAVSISLNAGGVNVKAVTVTAVTDCAPGIDAVQLSAERAAFKFLLRTRYPGRTNNEIEGFAALRQGASQFAQYAETVPGAGDDAKTRTSSLAKAASNLGSFRASIPLHAIPNGSGGPPATGESGEEIQITDEIRQAALLAEGVAHFLVGGEQDRLSAIDCFRQLQDWPGSSQTAAIRQQAAYNEAIVWRQRGYYGRCVLMLTELLGERAPDTVASEGPPRPGSPDQSPPLPDAVRFPARLARLAAFAKYTRDDWSTLPQSRAQLLLDDAEKLVEELRVLRGPGNPSAHDQRMAEYMYIEALRAVGHVELLGVITGPASSLYHDQRPTGLDHATLNEDGSKRLQRAVAWMRICEQLAPNYDLYCDLAESYLLLKDFTTAGGYARHATLEDSPLDERAYYLATESFFLQNTKDSAALARKYATDFKGNVQMEEFRSVRAALGIGDAPPAAAMPQPPP